MIVIEPVPRDPARRLPAGLAMVDGGVTPPRYGRIVKLRSEIPDRRFNVPASVRTDIQV